jgi:hypothetical protein
MLDLILGIVYKAIAGGAFLSDVMSFSALLKSLSHSEEVAG